MSDFDLLVRSEQDIGINGGKITALGKNLSGSARLEIDATKLTVLPGVIDAHVHFNEPGRTEWEGFATGSRAALGGGTTTIFDMPLNSHPPVIDGESFDAKHRAAEKNCLTDFGLWGGLVPDNLDQLETLKKRGVVGLKAFMCNSGIEDFPQVDKTALRKGMWRAADLDLLVAVHAESEEVTQKLSQEKIAAGRTGASDYLESRPVAAELEAIRRAVDLAADTGCRLHVVHVSCGRGVEIVREARAAGLDVTCETCPHYLFLSEEDLERIGATAKCAPPLRDPADRMHLWEMLPEVTTVGSDHSPSPPEMKAGENFFRIWGGISGVQHLLPLLLQASAEGRISVNRIADLTSRQVAERFRIAEKGGLEIGRDADFTLVDLKGQEEISRESLRYRHPQSPYLGRTLRGRVVRTFLRGQSVFHDGKFTHSQNPKLLKPHQT